MPNIGFKHSEESKLKIGTALKGKSKNRGRKHTEEARAKIGAASKGRIFSQEHRDKIGNAKRLTHAQRLQNYVINSEGCWVWLGSKNKQGYGIVGNGNRKLVGAHRLSYQEFKGEIPEGMDVCHSCDAPSCINPEHLFLGTAKENMADMIAKGRRRPDACGESNTRAKLTNVQAIEIRHSYKEGITQDRLAERHGVSQQVISRIIRGIGYKP